MQPDHQRRLGSRLLARVSAALALIVVLVGVPLGLFVVVRPAMPSWALLRDAWTHRHISSDVVVAIGVALFALLWLWFGATAITEAWSLRRWRSSTAPAPLTSVPPGPGRWVRVLVRVAVMSSVTAMAGGGALSAALAGSAHAAAVAATAGDLAGPVGPRIAQPETPLATPRSPSESLTPFLAGLGSALMVCVGAIAAVERSRRRQWRAAGVGARLAVPSLEQARAEMLMRSVDGAERLARLDLALRAIGPLLVARRGHVLAAMVADTGEVVIVATATQIDTHPPLPWSARPSALGSEWVLPAHLTLLDLAALADGGPHPCPAMVHLGRITRQAAELFLDLEGVGILSVVSPLSTDILSAVATSLAVSPFLDSALVLVSGLSPLLDERQRETFAAVEHVGSLDAALDVASMTLARRMDQFAGGAFATRVEALDATGDASEPVVVIAAHADVTASIAAELAAFPSGAGLGVVVDVAIAHSPWCIRIANGQHVLEPLGVVFDPVGLAASDLAIVTEVLEVVALPPATDARIIPIDDSVAVVPEFVEPEWSLLVRVLGPIEVVSADGMSVEFDRSKALELVVWLSQHRERSTRSAARTALWDLAVRDATFANVVSDARRAMARAVEPPDNSEWIARTLTDDLPLHPLVITDADLLAARVEHARLVSREQAIDILRPGVELLGGLPFAGTSFLWTDAEGITSSLVLLATGAAIELAQHLLAIDDIDGVFWATGQGLRVLAGHEELIALRMRAHARRGDLAGVRHEWESYERALAADSWAAANPSPKLVALRGELLAGRVSA